MPIFGVNIMLQAQGTTMYAEPAEESFGCVPVGGVPISFE
jgi:hypothetical protein